MHRSYQPITPASNKLLKQRWDETYFEEHKRKIAKSKAVVDNKPPRTYMHLHLKLKKLQLHEERLATVERDNRILLEKMSQIMRTKGRVDNWNDYSAKSLNRTKRQQELLRVTNENQAILKRVLAQKPVYDHAKWEDDWLEKESYMDSISKYPKEWYKKSASKKKSPSKGEGKQQDGSKRGSKKDAMSTSDREEKEEIFEVDEKEELRESQEDAVREKEEIKERENIAIEKQNKENKEREDMKHEKEQEEREHQEERVNEKVVEEKEATNEEPDEKPETEDKEDLEKRETTEHDSKDKTENTIEIS